MLSLNARVHAMPIPAVKTFRTTITPTSPMQSKHIFIELRCETPLLSL